MAGRAASLASALAGRLAAVVPSTVGVAASASKLSITAGDGSPLTIGIDQIVEQPGDLLDNLRLAAYAALAGTQDHVIRATGEKWPGPGALPLPGAAVESGRIELWFGDAAVPVLKLEPITLDELGIPPDETVR